jgi:hypothetical protein
MRLYAESAPSDLRRAYTAIINDLSNAESNAVSNAESNAVSNAESNAVSNAESSPSIERRALSAER